jgi:YVTN family beta-propeller protein
MHIRPYVPLFAALMLLSAILQSPAASLFVSNERDNTVTVLDSVTLKAIKTIPVGRRPRGIVVTPDHKEVLVCAGDDDRIDVIDTEKLQVTRHLDSGADPELLDVDPKGERVYIANEDDALMTVMDLKTGEVLAQVPVGVEPEGMRISADSRITVITSESTSMAKSLSPRTQEVYDVHLNRFAKSDAWGLLPAQQLTPPAVKKARDGMTDTPGMANQMLSVGRTLYGWAIPF